jgi:hypothetical protein
MSGTGTPAVHPKGRSAKLPPAGTDKVRPGWPLQVDIRAPSPKSDDRTSGRLRPACNRGHGEGAEANHLRSLFSCNRVGPRPCSGNEQDRPFSAMSGVWATWNCFPLTPKYSGLRRAALHRPRDLAWFCAARDKLPLFGGPRLLALGVSGFSRLYVKKPSADACAVASDSIDRTVKLSDMRSRGSRPSGQV